MILIKKIDNTQESSATLEGESPFRAAFRRKTHILSGTPPSKSLKRLKPHFQPLYNMNNKGKGGTTIFSESRAGADASNNHPSTKAAGTPLKGTTPDRTLTTSSLFPLPLQIARKCFSFEDTTTDDDNFLAMPKDLGMRNNPNYGLSAVASYPSDYDDTTSLTAEKSKEVTAIDNITNGTHLSSKKIPQPKWHPPHRTRLLDGGPDSPFRVIRHSQTWDHQGNSPTRNGMHSNKMGNQYAIDGIRQSASFDLWPPPSSSSTLRQSCHHDSGRERDVGWMAEKKIFYDSSKNSSAPPRQIEESAKWKVRFCSNID